MASLGFIPASEQDAFCFRSDQTSCNRSSKLSGEEVRRFYEDLMKDDKTQKHENRSSLHKNSRDRRSNRMTRSGIRAGRVNHADSESVVQRGTSMSSERAQELQGLRLLRCAQEGDIPGLKELISKGVDINFQVATLKMVVCFQLDLLLLAYFVCVSFCRTHISGQL